MEGAIERGIALDALALPPAVPAGLPSDLLQRRPDIREAEQRLIAANARIGVARAAYYPSISLTGMFGFESEKLVDLFSAPARIWQFSAGAAQTVFDAGRTDGTGGHCDSAARTAARAYTRAPCKTLFAK